MLDKLKKFMWGYPILAIILAAAGVCLISLTDSLKYLAITIGAILTAVGIVFAIIVIASKNRDVSFAFKVIFGSICIICGIITMIFNERSVEILISVFSLLLIVDASFKLQTSAMSMRYGVVLWWVILTLSVLTIIGAYRLIQFPFAEQESSSIWLGVVFIIDAISNLLSAFYVSAYEKRHYNEAYLEAYMDARETFEAARAARSQGVAEENEEFSESSEGRTEHKEGYTKPEEENEESEL